MLLLYAALVPVFIISGWLYTISTTRGRFPMLRNKRICLLIAHPDDEAMFFAPALLQLTKPEAGNHVKILCLSSGDADGLGETRKKELVKSGMQLGLRNESDVFVVENPYVQPHLLFCWAQRSQAVQFMKNGLTLTRRDFKDSMTATWDANKISGLLSSAFAPHLTTLKTKSKSSTAPTATIDVLITFDSQGVSSHPNHISLYHGARTFVRSLLTNRPGWESPVYLYTLTSVNMVRKYLSVVDVLTTLVATLVGKKEGMKKGVDVLKGDGKGVSPLLFLSDAGDVRRAQRAMTHAHISQMRWFRWGWIGLSRYMVVNDLRLEKIIADVSEIPEKKVEEKVEKVQNGNGKKKVENGKSK